MAYDYTPEMGEISGFGGGYEARCRAMVKAGLEWFDAHPDADPKFHGFKDVYGLITEDNDHAKALSDAVTNAPGADGCTGAMHQAAISHIFFVRKNGWDAYVKEMSEPEKTAQ